MAGHLSLTHPWLIAVWPGMGGVAFNAGVFLLSKLDMLVMAEFEADELFDISQVEVKEGIVQPGRRPRNRFFLWKDPKQAHDLVLFLGEAQPPLGRYTFCRRLIAFAKTLGIERVFTFAAMATQMHPASASRLFGAATDRDGVEELKQLEVEPLKEGQIGGLNGVLLAAAAEAGLPGACLLGEMPHVFHQLPFPKASLAILEVFTTLARLEMDFAELAEQGRMVEEQLGELLERLQHAFQPEVASEGEYRVEPAEEERLEPDAQRRIDDLFDRASKDRAKAFELKRELDRLGVFKDYEDRFLDLFKKSN
jgi:uncharacterized protein